MMRSRASAPSMATTLSTWQTSQLESRSSIPGSTASVDGIADVHGTAGEGAPFNHSTWIWGGLSHYGLGYMKGGHKVNPCEKCPYHMTRHWYGEDGAHIWSS